uniref:Uncharacterized protein n=1 Tax=Caenorhabditis japonica TaxID=281687 RepID=A0A8R1IPC2_CAEJA
MNKLASMQKCKAFLADTHQNEHFKVLFTDEKLLIVEAEFDSQNHGVFATTIQEANEKMINITSYPEQVMVFGAIHLRW